MPGQLWTSCQVGPSPSSGVVSRDFLQAVVGHQGNLNISVGKGPAVAEMMSDGKRGCLWFIGCSVLGLFSSFTFRRNKDTLS